MRRSWRSTSCWCSTTAAHEPFGHAHGHTRGGLPMEDHFCLTLGVDTCMRKARTSSISTAPLRRGRHSRAALRCLRTAPRHARSSTPLGTPRHPDPALDLALYETTAAAVRLRARAHGHISDGTQSARARAAAAAAVEQNSSRLKPYLSRRRPFALSVPRAA
jgi:hypothetical protein